MPLVPLAALDTSEASLAAAQTVHAVGPNGAWTRGPEGAWNDLAITVGDKLTFSYSSNHNVWYLPSQTAFDRCSFSELNGAVELRESWRKPHRYEAVVTEPGTLFFACEVGSHCDDGQKVRVTVTAPDGDASPPPPSPPPLPPWTPPPLYPPPPL